MKKQVSTSMIANEAGIAVSTTGFILNGKARKMKISEKTEQRVLAIAKDLGYVPNALAKNLRRNRSGIIGLLYNHLKHHWADDSLKGVRSVLSGTEYSPFLSTHEFDANLLEKEVELMLQHRFDAIISVPFKEGRETYQRIIENGTPLIFLNDTVEGMSDVDMVAWNAREASKTAINHLVSLGRKDIGFLGWNNGRRMIRARGEAYRSYLKREGIDFREDWMRLFPLEADISASVVEMFSKRDRPDALFCGLDIYGIQAIGALEGMGLRVPDDVAVVGMGNQPGSEFPSIGLSTVNSPNEQIGVKAAELALELIENKQTCTGSSNLLHGDDLLVRRSTKA
jgi:DNA-binding LacI/PurR family transcriptional regulator